MKRAMHRASFLWARTAVLLVAFLAVSASATERNGRHLPGKVDLPDGLNKEVRITCTDAGHTNTTVVTLTDIKGGEHQELLHKLFEDTEDNAMCTLEELQQPSQKIKEKMFDQKIWLSGEDGYRMERAGGSMEKSHGRKNKGDGRMHMDDKRMYIGDGRMHMDDERMHMDDERMHMYDEGMHMDDKRMHMGDSSMQIDDKRMYMDDGRMHMSDGRMHMEDERMHMDDSRMKKNHKHKSRDGDMLGRFEEMAMLRQMNGLENVTLSTFVNSMVQNASTEYEEHLKHLALKRFNITTKLQQNEMLTSLTDGGSHSLARLSSNAAEILRELARASADEPMSEVMKNIGAQMLSLMEQERKHWDEKRWHDRDDHLEIPPPPMVDVEAPPPVIVYMPPGFEEGEEEDLVTIQSSRGLLSLRSLLQERGEKDCYTREMWSEDKFEYCCSVFQIGCAELAELNEARRVDSNGALAEEYAYSAYSTELDVVQVDDEGWEEIEEEEYEDFDEQRLEEILKFKFKNGKDKIHEGKDKRRHADNVFMRLVRTFGVENTTGLAWNYTSEEGAVLVGKIEDLSRLVMERKEIVKNATQASDEMKECLMKKEEWEDWDDIYNDMDGYDDIYDDMDGSDDIHDDISDDMDGHDEITMQRMEDEKNWEEMGDGDGDHDDEMMIAMMERVDKLTSMVEELVSHKDMAAEATSMKNRASKSKSSKSKRTGEFEKKKGMMRCGVHDPEAALLELQHEELHALNVKGDKFVWAAWALNVAMEMQAKSVGSDDSNGDSEGFSVPLGVSTAEAAALADNFLAQGDEVYSEVRELTTQLTLLTSVSMMEHKKGKHGKFESERRLAEEKMERDHSERIEFGRREGMEEFEEREFDEMERRGRRGLLQVILEEAEVHEWDEKKEEAGEWMGAALGDACWEARKRSYAVEAVKERREHAIYEKLYTIMYGRDMREEAADRDFDAVDRQGMTELDSFDLESEWIEAEESATETDGRGSRVMIIGVSVAAVVVFIAALVCGCCLCQRRRSRGGHLTGHCGNTHAEATRGGAMFANISDKPDTVLSFGTSGNDMSSAQLKAFEQLKSELGAVKPSVPPPVRTVAGVVGEIKGDDVEASKVVIGADGKTKKERPVTPEEELASVMDKLRSSRQSSPTNSGRVTTPPKLLVEQPSGGVAVGRQASGQCVLERGNSGVTVPQMMDGAEVFTNPAHDDSSANIQLSMYRD